ncbi:hypothetical protein C5167_017664 [Papaver somniferum]|uniref:Transcription factor CBF/NF-Y/archaeal histone domain-containing protein n=1 Tax=Papaver somniferum TaxID=3469 RepID=A0A4Y7IP58_PAPSO|nr:nuclear transcription factor Y subunit B-3-like [Papaver somniferum]RZC49245.1 hypothetical protein C5167_017664 [Papaver somniferum]
MTRKRSQNNEVKSPTSSAGSANDNDSATANISKDQYQFLPIANVSRIMKNSLPSNAKISKKAKETVQECVSEFISFVTGEASDKCQREKRKTINGDDLLWAMTTLGFENYVGSLKIYLNKYREVEGEKNNMARHGDDDDQFPLKEEIISNTTNDSISGRSVGNKIVTNFITKSSKPRGVNAGSYSTGSRPW